MAYFEGLRMKESCQLGPDDFGCENGIAVIYARAGEGQKVKSANSIRTIPVHPELIRLGILELVAQKRKSGSRRLFDVDRGLDGTFSSRFSKTYHNWRHSMGIYEPGKDFHSLRKDFYQALKSARVDYAARVVLMGHELNDVSETSYGLREWEIEDMAEFIYSIPADTKHIAPVVRD